MKGGTVQINWHNLKPVLSLDFHPISGALATGGADFEIKIWLINSADPEKKVPTASYQCCLSHHSAAVNVLRFSPSGEQIASGADGGELLIWKLHPTETGQTWKLLKTFSFHRKDVLDLQWSADGAFLISGSVDNSCLIWDVNKGSVHQILDAHFHYVQGVAWDPLSKYVASLSSDRTCRIYVNKPQTKSKGTEKINYVCQHVIAKAEQQLSDDSKSTKNHLFHDETLPSFFRRLSWSPDGSFLLVPAGGLFNLPYRLIFAVATLNSLYVYDTESNSPIAVLAGLHYAAITDIAWSSDARYLALSSQDGYCTLVEFENDELGSPILPEPNKMTDDSQSPIQKAEDMAIEATPNDNSVAVNDTTKSEGEKTEVKQTPPASTSTPIVNNKSAKRRITPMAIDP
ncbi:hypothetical protein G4B88_002586 [Cannabis sativa]|uniref:CAF-1 p60 homolog n=1 Tax=Cannabis sativa TaxID=3483 RepID=A0A7J6I856_CANSA|nr:hypothetical protein G4B88_002586 [Cannabis sativa]